MKHIVIILCSLILFSCNTNQDTTQASKVEIEFPTKSVTIWSDKTEMFVEFPALVVGKPSRFAAHFTILENHKPVEDGSVTVSLIKGVSGIRATAESPSSPGIFSPTLQPNTAGNYQLVFELTTTTYNDNLVVQDVIVYANEEAAINALDGVTDDGGISFLKEQAWKIDFQTAVISKGDIFDVINTSGVWKPSPDASKVMSAGSKGIVEYKAKNLTEGTLVKRGQLLLQISSKGLVGNNLGSEIDKAKANYDQANSEYNRKKELYKSKIVSKSDFEKAENNFLIAKSNFETLSNGVSGGSKLIRAPFDGFIKKLHVSNGEFVNQSTTVIEIISQNSKILEAQLSASYDVEVGDITNIWYRTKSNKWQGVNEIGSILSIGKSVDKRNPLVSIFALVNSNDNVTLGSFAEVQIGFGKASSGIIIPENSLLENYGSFSVILQLSGETFERRTVTIGRQNGTSVEITSGLEVGDVVVTKGAYQVKMASMSGTAPAHGHAH